MKSPAAVVPFAILLLLIAVARSGGGESEPSPSLDNELDLRPAPSDSDMIVDEPVGGGRIISNEVIVLVRPRTAQATLRELAKSAGATIEGAGVQPDVKVESDGDAPLFSTIYYLRRRVR